ncbi:MAG: M2 family metallopeptidase, partial [bacterium]
ASWDLAITGSDEAAARSEAATHVILEHYSQRGPYQEAIRLLNEGGHDPLTTRQLLTIKHEYLYNQFPPEVLAQLAKLGTELETTLTTFRGTIDGKPVSDNDATAVLQTSNDSVARQKAWEATKQVGGVVEPKLRELIRIRNAAAQALGYPDYYHLALDAKEIDIKWMIDLWERLETLTNPAWNALKGELDGRLAARFGIAVAELRPWHYEDPFFQKAPQNPNANLDAWYSAVDIEAVTNRTFESMGQPIADLAANSSLYPAPNKYQAAFCTSIAHDSDIRVCCNIVRNERWMATNLHEFGHAAYEKYVDPSLPWMLRTAAHSITTEGIAIFMGNLANDPEWMRDHAGIDPQGILDTLPVIRQQKQLEDMIFTRWELLMCHFERELYRDPEQDLNTLWWDLAERYQGLTRPKGRDWPDYAAKIHFSIAPCMYQNYLFGYMFITQLGQHLRANITHGGPLASPEVGRYLREYVYQPGASLRWDALIEHATGAPLDPQHWVAHITAGLEQPVGV